MTLLLMLLLKSLLVFALSGVVLLCLRRASASARHLVCFLTLAALLALPLFSLTLPGWHVAGLSTSDPLPASPVATEQDPPTLISGGVGTAHAKTKAVLVPAEAPANRPTPAPPLLRARGNLFSLPLLLLSLYILGVVLAGLRPLLGLWGIAHLRRACAAVTDAPTLGVSADCAAALRLTRRPQLCQADVPVPMTWGGRRPVVLLPSGPAEWPEDRLRSVLLHEMAHVKRRDWACHRLADAACALYWFHPLVWLTARRLRSESEVACDDLVLSSGVAAPEYARHLLEIAGALSRPLPSQSAIAMAQTPHINRRILMILDKTLTRRTVTRRALLFALTPSAAALLALAALRPSIKAQAAPPPAAATDTASSSVATLPNGVWHSNLRFGNVTTVTMDNHGGPPSLSTSPDLTINGTTLFAGITDANKPGSPWWSADGALLMTHIYDTSLTPSHFQGEAGTRTVSFAFRLPAGARDVTTKYKISGSTSSSSGGVWPTKLGENAGSTEGQIFASTGGARVVTAAFPTTLKKTNLQIGIASGAWRRAATEIRTSGTVEPFEEVGTTLAGNQSFILGQPVQAAKEVTLTVSDTSVDDIRVVAVDTQGNTLYPVTIGSQSVSNLDQITAHFSQPLSQIKEFRVETRSFQWIEFKNVALQPVQ